MTRAQLIRYRRRHPIKKYHTRDYTMPMSRDPNRKRTYTAKSVRGGVVTYIGTFDSMTDCAQAHKAYIKRISS